jgi:2-keto-3-deoxy-L-arabinonate dehydratase
MSVELRGLVPILATPFAPSGELDVPSLRQLVRFQLEAGVDGLGLFGFASEAFALTASERERIIELVLKETDGRIPLVAGVGGTAAGPAADEAARMADAGAAMVMVMPPGLVKPSADALIAFYEEVAARSGVAVMVQDAPALTGVDLPAELLGRLTEVPGVTAIKIEAQPTAVAVERAVRASGGRLAVFGGQNALFLLDELDRGAIGTMPGCEFSDVLRSVLDRRGDGDDEGARLLFNHLLPLIRYGLQPGIAWAVHKEVLVARGIVASPTVRPPARELDPASAAGLQTLLSDLAGEGLLMAVSV